MTPNLKHAANQARESELKQLLRSQLAERGLPEPMEECALVPRRKFRGDLCWPNHVPPVCLEIHGGRFAAVSGHRSTTGLVRDWEKANLAQLSGWIYLQASPEWIEDGTAVELVARALGQEAA